MGVFLLVILIVSACTASSDTEAEAGHCLTAENDGFHCSDDLEWADFDNDSMTGLDAGFCNIEKIGYISNEQFLYEYAYEKPVIFMKVNDNSEFRRLSTRTALLEKYANNTITISTANTHSYRKVQMPLREYVKEILRPQSVDMLGKDTLYFFGNNNHTEWDELFRTYEQPPYTIPGKSGAYSFGIAGAGTGVPFHFHGPGFSEVIYGGKRWFLYPYEDMPKFDPDQNVLTWVMEEYPHLSQQNKPLECTIKPGEVLYFPDRWWHSTLNLKTSVFMSTFLG